MKLPFARNKTETLELPPEDAAAKPLAETLAEILHERLPHTHAPDLRQSFECLGSEIWQAMELFSRRLVLDAIATMPLADFIDQIEAAKKPVIEARGKLETVSRELGVLTAQSEEMAASGDFDASAYSEIRNRVGALKSRLDDAGPLRASIDKLVSTVEKFGARIHPLARLQTGRSPAIGRWYGQASHAGLGAKVTTDPVQRASKILEVADSALTELDHLDRGELPEPFPPAGFGGRERASVQHISFWI
jgi:hypothetical protein